MKLSTAHQIAHGLLLTLGPVCERIEIAGSIRRANKPDVKDIEIVAIPKMVDISQPTLFVDGHDHLEQVSLLDERLTEMVQAKTLTPAGLNGNRLKTFFVPNLEDAIKLDLFIVLPPAQWGVIFTIRTGPADFSKWLVTRADKGGALPAGLYVNQGALFGPSGLIDTPTEVSFFEAIGLNYIDPAKRQPHWSTKGSGR